jgi:squalene cyclase
MLVSGSLQRGVEFLLARQGSDGYWRDFCTPAGEASEWPTGFVGSMLRVADVRTKAIDCAAEALLASQRRDGGWGYNEEVPSDADSTAWVLLFLTRAGYSGAASARAAAYIAGHQRRNSGGIATYSQPGPIRRYMGLGRWVPLWGWCRPNCEVTATSGTALAMSDRSRYREALRAWQYVRSRQQRDGCWRSYWWNSAHYATLQAVELGTLFRDTCAVQRAAAWCIQNEDEGGGWSAHGAGASAFATALCVSVLVEARADAEVIDRTTRRLRALQMDDGGWPSHPILRIPLPSDWHLAGDRRRPIRFDTGIVAEDQQRTFTSAVCVGALARASDAGGVGQWAS